MKHLYGVAYGMRLRDCKFGYDLRFEIVLN